MTTRAFCSFALVAGTLFSVLPAGISVAATATVATDVCPVNANPCNVTTVFDVTPNAELDFGVRTLNITGAGQFNFGINSGKIRAGNIVVNTTGVAIDANGPGLVSGTDSGFVLIEARRTCSTASVPCVDFSDCAVGDCDTRRCTLSATKKCLQDADCLIGGGECKIVSTAKRCGGDTKLPRCTTNADCSFGTCPQQLTCTSLRGGNPVSCATNGDCDAGICSIGSASINMGGAILGNSDNPAGVELRAADNVSVSKNISLDSSDLDSPGGDFTAEAAAGSVSLSGKISAHGGGASTGGTVDLLAGLDVIISEDIDLDGGDGDGGAFDATAERDLLMNRSISANAVSGGGYGGEIVADAGRDLAVTAPSALAKTTFGTSGHTSADNTAGEGGSQDFTSGRNMTFAVNTRLIGNGSPPDGTGSDFTVDATGALVMSGDMTAKAEGGQGAGGYIEALSDGPFQVTSTGTFTLTGGSSDGGVVAFHSLSNADYSGFLDVSGGNGGDGGSAAFDFRATANINGKMFVNGADNGDLEVDACRLLLNPTANLDNNVDTGINRLYGREMVKLFAGSQMTTGPSGLNRILYRSPAKPPIILGTVSPAPSIELRPDLKGCPVCGNNELDDTETCEDGNTVNGDGCNSNCQNEKCVQQTAPAFACTSNADCAKPSQCNTGTHLCDPHPTCDDNNACTVDSCNQALNGGTCQHASNACNDNVACTIDTCNPFNALDKLCSHAEDNAACDDSNTCTTNTCSKTAGCVSTNNTNPCTDNVECTTNDMCVSGACVGTPGEGCGFCGDGQKLGGEACDDGNAVFNPGEYCGLNCVLIPCGKPSSGTVGTTPKTSDALFTLRAAVGQISCALQVCDVNSSGKVTTTDAQRILQKAVGQVVSMVCPPAP